MGFGGNRRWDFFYACWGEFIDDFDVFGYYKLYFQGKLGCNFPFERGRVVVSI